MLGSLVVLAPLSLLASDLSRGWAWPLALLAGLRALVAARRHARLPARRVLVPAGGADATCDGLRMPGLQVGWRGPLAFLCWHDAGGAPRRLSFWPDTLDAGMRRELKLAMQRRKAAGGAPSMAG